MSGEAALHKIFCLQFSRMVLFLVVDPCPIPNYTYDQHLSAICVFSFDEIWF